MKSISATSFPLTNTEFVRLLLQCLVFAGSEIVTSPSTKFWMQLGFCRYASEMVSQQSGSVKMQMMVFDPKSRRIITFNRHFDHMRFSIFLSSCFPFSFFLSF